MVHSIWTISYGLCHFDIGQYHMDHIIQVYIIWSMSFWYMDHIICSISYGSYHFGPYQMVHIIWFIWYWSILFWLISYEPYDIVPIILNSPCNLLSVSSDFLSVFELQCPENKDQTKYSFGLRAKWTWSDYNSGLIRNQLKVCLYFLSDK